jgi:hypothetical protein
VTETRQEHHQTGQVGVLHCTVLIVSQTFPYKTEQRLPVKDFVSSISSMIFFLLVRKDCNYLL